jgi:Leucine-rich repeat (LRR) protein
MSTAKLSVSIPGSSRQLFSMLLQLPDAAVALVFQQLLEADPHSLFHAATTCSKLSTAYTSIKKITGCCKGPPAALAFTRWLGRRSISLSNLQECSIHTRFDESGGVLGRLPCPQLRRLQLQGVELLSDLASGCPVALQDCTGLTALSLQSCTVPDMAAIFTALPQLQCLDVVRSWNRQGNFAFAKLQRPQKFKSLYLDFHPDQPEQAQHLSQLSALVNLEHLSLSGLQINALPHGLPPQLQLLTSLKVTYNRPHSDKVEVSEDFRHLSSFKAL